MKLLKLILQGFKSFADKTTIEFADGMTVIVGPNGCGKSNISDAVRWVLGEQNVRNIRGQKAEDVIFSGSEVRSQKNAATVTLVFDNSNNELPLDTAEVSIARKVYRDGESEFFINKAIGWALRDYSKTNPQWVKDFIEKYKNNMASLSIREASKYI